MAPEFAFRNWRALADKQVKEAFDASGNFHDSFLRHVKKKRGLVCLELSDIYFHEFCKYGVFGIHGAEICVQCTGELELDELDLICDLSNRNVYEIRILHSYGAVHISVQDIYDLSFQIDISASRFRWRFSEPQ
ncbi:MAG: hypothetical protein R3D56_08330 [Paracoccaceae bacterium]